MRREVSRWTGRPLSRHYTRSLQKIESGGTASRPRIAGILPPSREVEAGGDLAVTYEAGSVELMALRKRTTSSPTIDNWWRSTSPHSVMEHLLPHRVAVAPVSLESFHSHENDLPGEGKAHSEGSVELHCRHGSEEMDLREKRGC